MMVLRRLFIHRFSYVPLRVQLHALRFRCSVLLSMANLRKPVYPPNVGEGAFSEVGLSLYGVLGSCPRSRCWTITLLFSVLRRYASWHSHKDDWQG
jgi:hypothetical protein